MNLEYKIKNSKDAYKPHRSNTHVVEYDSDSSGDEDNEVYTTEFVWPSSAKPCSCASLKLTQKGQKEEMKFTFYVSKCDLFLMSCCVWDILRLIMSYRRLKS